MSENRRLQGGGFFLITLNIDMMSFCCVHDELHWFWCQGPSKARALPNSTMVGIGLTMEGINQNNVMYEFMLENSWRQRPRNVTEWFEFLH